MSIRNPSDLAGRFEGLLAADSDYPVAFGPAGLFRRADLHHRAGQLGRAAPLRDLQPGQVVALALPNGPHFLAALLATWRRDGVALLLDRDTPTDRNRLLARQFGAVAAVHSAAGDTVVEPVAPATAARWPAAAVIKLTSGSTGSPRGVLVAADALFADTAALEQVMGIDTADRVVAGVPMSFSYGLGSVAVPAVVFGRQLVLPDPSHPLGAMTMARQHAATVLPTVPAFLSALLKRDAAWHLPATIRLVISAGAPLRPAVARAFRQRFGQPVHTFYGASECGGITFDRVGDAAEAGTVGTPIPGVDVRIAPATGLVEVRSPAVATSYIPPAAQLADGVYRSGDLATWQGDALRLCGRQGAIINVGGHKVDPREVEGIIEQLPGVSGVHVMGLGEHRDICCAVVESTALTRRQVREWCQAQMPVAKRPRRILVVPELPRNARGKVAAERVRELAEADESRT